MIISVQYRVLCDRMTSGSFLKSFNELHYQVATSKYKNLAAQKSKKPGIKYSSLVQNILELSALTTGIWPVGTWPVISNNNHHYLIFAFVYYVLHLFELYNLQRSLSDHFVVYSECL